MVEYWLVKYIETKRNIERDLLQKPCLKIYSLIYSSENDEHAQTCPDYLTMRSFNM